MTEGGISDQTRGWSTPSFFGTAVQDPGPPTVERAPATEWGSVTTYGRPAKPPADAESNRGVLASSRVMAIASLASRVTGFARSVALAAALGTALVGDAYNSANSFPNMVYELLLGGVLSSVLIPLLVHAQEHDADGGRSYTARLLSVATAFLGVATLLAVLGAPLLARAFVSNPAQRELTSIFATLLLPEIFFYGLGAMFTAVLNTRGSYAPGAWAPVLNNVVVLGTVGVFLALPGPKVLDPVTITTPQILVIGIGTTLGIVAQALALVPALRSQGFRWRWRLRGTPDERGRLREVGTLTGWVLGYVVASQIGVSVILAVAIPANGVSTFTYADLLFQMPYGILGVSLLTALMPRMSRAAARGAHDEVVRDLSLGARLSTLALLPVTAGFIALGPAFTTVLFAYGRVSFAGARLIGVALASAAFGLLPFAIVMLQLRVFYATKDGRTPTLINVFMVATKVTLVLAAHSVLHGRALVVALNVSTSASYVVGAVVGHIMLTRRFGRLGFLAVVRTVVRVGIASAVGGAAAYALVAAFASVGGPRVSAALGLATGGVLGLAALIAALVALRVPELRELRAAIRR